MQSTFCLNGANYVMREQKKNNDLLNMYFYIANMSRHEEMFQMMRCAMYFNLYSDIQLQNFILYTESMNGQSAMLSLRFH